MLRVHLSVHPPTHSFIRCRRLQVRVSRRRPYQTETSCSFPVSRQDRLDLCLPPSAGERTIAVDWGRTTTRASPQTDAAIGRLVRGKSSRVRAIAVECGSEGSVFADRPWREPTRRMPPRGAQTPWWISSPGGSTSGVSLKRAAMMEADFTSRCVYSHEHEASPRDPRPWRTP